MRDLTTQATNKLNIVGKLLDATFREGETKDHKPYESCNFTVRVTQQVNGVQETSEIPVSIFASKYTRDGKPHPGYKNIQEMKDYKTVQDYGEAEASMVRMTSATVRENNYVSRTKQLINGWQINTSFINEGGKNEIASFNIDIYIMDMKPEEDRNEEETGRLIIKGAVVQYGGVLDILEFVVEGADQVEYIKRNWEIKTTVNVGGRIRVTSQEEKKASSEGSWGEELPETSTRMVRELVITRGSDEPFEEEFAYSEQEIRKGFNARKARLEQMQIDAKNSATTKSAPATGASKSYSWE